MALNFAFKVYVCFDTPTGFEYVTCSRNTWTEVVALLSTFEFMPLFVSINEFRK